MLDMGTPWYRPRAATAAELVENYRSEGGVRLEQLSEQPEVGRALSLSKDRLIEDWIDVLTIGESDTMALRV